MIPKEPSHPPHYFDIEAWIGTILTIGVLLSAAFIVTEIIWKWKVTGHLQLDYNISGTNLFEFFITDIQQLCAGSFRPRLFLNLGIAALMLTPYLRVLASLIYFAIFERNPKYTVFTGLVLSILTYTLFLR